MTGRGHQANHYHSFIKKYVRQFSFFLPTQHSHCCVGNILIHKPGILSFLRAICNQNTLCSSTQSAFVQYSSSGVTSSIITRLSVHTTQHPGVITQSRARETFRPFDHSGNKRPTPTLVPSPSRVRVRVRAESEPGSETEPSPC